ncbi:MAG: nucleoside 2-deoxyribosyltransferase domain-containing protein [Crocinitomicaceae bacterium]
MVFTSRNNTSQLAQNRTCIFLAGSMAQESSSNWRKTVVNQFGDTYHFFVPTHPNHDQTGDDEMKTHIEWELNGLAKADFILLNFLADARSPISMVEMGMYIQSGKLIVVCPKNFYKRRYVETLCEKYTTPLFNHLDQLLNGALDTIINEKTQIL